MFLLFVLVVGGAATALLYQHLRKQRNRRSLWRRTFQIALVVGLARAVLASTGWYAVEHSGGRLSVPGFAFAMLAWPEGALLPAPRTRPAPMEFYVFLSATLIGTTVLVTGIVGFAASKANARET